MGRLDRRRGGLGVGDKVGEGMEGSEGVGEDGVMSEEEHWGEVEEVGYALDGEGMEKSWQGMVR